MKALKEAAWQNCKGRVFQTREISVRKGSLARTGYCAGNVELGCISCWTKRAGWSLKGELGRKHRGGNFSHKDSPVHLIVQIHSFCQYEDSGGVSRWWQCLCVSRHHSSLLPALIVEGWESRFLNVYFTYCTSTMNVAISQNLFKNMLNNRNVESKTRQWRVCFLCFLVI